MTFFDWFMAVIGIICMITIIFWVVCKIRPELRKNKTINDLYSFIVGYGADNLYDAD